MLKCTRVNKISKVVGYLIAILVLIMTHPAPNRRVQWIYLISFSTITGRLPLNYFSMLDWLFPSRNLHITSCLSLTWVISAPSVCLGYTSLPRPCSLHLLSPCGSYLQSSAQEQKPRLPLFSLVIGCQPLLFNQSENIGEHSLQNTIWCAWELPLDCHQILGANI